MQIFGGRAFRAEGSQSREASVSGVGEQRDNQDVRTQGSESIVAWRPL